MQIIRRLFTGASRRVPRTLRAAQSQVMGKAPNILFLFPDQLRFDWIQNPVLPVHTPNLDILASRGVRFVKAYCTSPICAPARASLVAGRDYDDCGVPTNDVNYPLHQDTYFRRLKAAGYHVAACGKLDLNKAVLNQGVDGRLHMADWGFDDMVNCGGKGDAVRNWEKTKAPHEPYMAYLAGRGLADAHAADIKARGGGGGSAHHYTKTDLSPLPEDAYQDNWIGNTGLELLGRVPAGKPWHLMINFAGPHDPLDITARMKETVKDRQFSPPLDSTQLTPEIHNQIRQNYTAMIENIDRWVGIYVDELKRRGEFDTTIIVFSSDHGEMLGDHDRWAKNVPYDASVCVPLIISGPGIKPRTSDALVSVPDLAATFLDYAHAKPTRKMTARSLRPLLEGRIDDHRQYVTAGLFDWRLVCDGRYKLVRGFDPGQPSPRRSRPNGATGPFILFDLRNDPYEKLDIAAGNPKVVARLKKKLPRPEPASKLSTFVSQRWGKK